MKIREITEQRQQVDEVVPVIGAALGALGGISIPGTTMTLAGLFGWSMATLTAIELVDLVIKLQKDPDSMTYEDWVGLAVSAAFSIGPAKYLGSRVKDKVLGLIPDTAKKELGDKLKDKFGKELKQEFEKRTAEKGASTTAQSADNIYAPQPRKNRVDTMPAASKEPAASKNPNWKETPFKKEELMRLAGLAK